MCTHLRIGSYAPAICKISEKLFLISINVAVLMWNCVSTNLPTIPTCCSVLLVVIPADSAVYLRISFGTVCDTIGYRLSLNSTAHTQEMHGCSACSPFAVEAINTFCTIRLYDYLFEKEIRESSSREKQLIISSLQFANRKILTIGLKCFFFVFHAG